MRVNDPDTYKLVTLCLVTKGLRTPQQRSSAVTMISEVIKEKVVSRKRWGLLLNQRQYVADRQYTEGFDRDEAFRKWAEDEKNPLIYKETSGVRPSLQCGDLRSSTRMTTSRSVVA